MSAEEYPPSKADECEGAFFTGVGWPDSQYRYQISVQGSYAIIKARLVRKDRHGGGAVALARALIGNYAIRDLRLPEKDNHAVRDRRAPALEWSWKGEDELHPGYPQVRFVLRRSKWGGSPLTRLFRRQPHPKVIFAAIERAQEVLWAAMDEARHLDAMLRVVEFAW